MSHTTTPTGKEIVKVDTVLLSVHMKVTDNASNIKKDFSFFYGSFCFLHTLELVVCEFMEDDSVKPCLMKIKGPCRHLKMSLTGWSCFVELCDMKHIAIAKPPIGGHRFQRPTSRISKVLRLKKMTLKKMTLK